jgi:hypothetical protein
MIGLEPTTTTVLIMQLVFMYLCPVYPYCSAVLPQPTTTQRHLEYEYIIIDITYNNSTRVERQEYYQAANR